MHFMKIFISSLIIFATTVCVKTSTEAEHEKHCRTARLRGVIGYLGKDNENLELRGVSKLLINYAVIESISEKCNKPTD